MWRRHNTVDQHSVDIIIFRLNIITKTTKQLKFSAHPQEFQSPSHNIRKPLGIMPVSVPTILQNNTIIIDLSHGPISPSSVINQSHMQDIYSNKITTLSQLEIHVTKKQYLHIGLCFRSYKLLSKCYPKLCSQY